MAKIVIEDELHAEPQGEFASFRHAVEELKHRAQVPWDREPNRAPCENWQTCGRAYEVVEYDDTRSPWQETRRVPVLSVSASGVIWSASFEEGTDPAPIA